MNLPEFQDVTSLAGIPGPGCKNVIAREVYIFVHDEGSEHQRHAIIELFSYTGGAYATVKWGDAIGGQVLRHRGDYKVKVEVARVTSGLPTSRFQFISVTGGQGLPRNFCYKQILRAVHNRLINGLRDGDWWLAAYGKRRESSLRWSSEHIAAQWRVPRSKRTAVAELETQLAEERRRESQKFGWLDEPVPGEGRP